MEHVPETLQSLVRRRLREIGAARGRPEGLSLLEAYSTVSNPEITYEVVRRVEKDGHTNIGAKAVRTIATMLDVAENDVRTAAGQRPSIGPWQPPPEADQLSEKEREALEGLIKVMVQERQPAPRAAVGHRLQPVTEIRHLPAAAMEPRRDQPPPGASEEPMT